MIYLQTVGYNLQTAKILGIRTAVFIGCLIDEYSYQSRNKLLNSNNTMSLSRAEIYAKTALDDDEQVEIERSLSECGVLVTKPLQNVPNKNYYILDNDKLSNILTADNPEDVIGKEKAAQFTRPTRVEPASKRKTYIENLKKKINVSDPVIQTYFIDWIDAVYTRPKGFLSPKGVEIAQQELKAYCGDNQDKQIAVMKIAIKGGLRDLTWAIEQYENHLNKTIKESDRNFASYSDIKSNEVPTDASVEVY